MKAVLVDVFCDGRLVHLWLRANEKNFFLKDTIKPVFFVGAEKKQLVEIQKFLGESFGEKICVSKIVEKKDFESDKLIEVLEVSMLKVKLQRQVIREIERLYDFQLNFFNSDVELDRLYLFEKNVRPLQEVCFEVSGDWVRNLRPLKFNSFVENYPKFKIVELEVTQSNGVISVVRLNDDFFRGKEEELLSDFKRAFEFFDADVVLTRNGNKFEFDLLKERFRHYKIDFCLGRKPDKFTQKTGKSYFSYGRVIRHEPARYLRGRLHVQINDFHYSECGLDGVFEIAHSTVMPIQKAARLGSGNCISNLQFYVAFQKGYLIPEKKNQVERFNSGWHLFEADKGGLVFEPLKGLHEGVVELDFSSLYPSIMVNHNVSPETILCECCDSIKVPGLGYNICQKRRGLISEVLEPILKKRLYYKHLKSVCVGSEKEKYKAMSNALKWLLVVSFGYTGFKNARFGRIEAHQSICAFAREKLLDAARICEDNGFEVVHGIVDALYIKKKGFTAKEISEIVEKIFEECGVEIVVEGIFKWIVFLPRMSNQNVSTPTRFFGLYQNNEFKVRGVQLRRSDSPKAIVKLQEEMLNIFAGASNFKEFKEILPIALNCLREWTAKLYNNLIPIEDLTVRVDVSKKIEEYKANIAQKAALIQWKQRGVEVNEGEPVFFVYTNFSAKNFLDRVKVFPSDSIRIDFKKYEELFVRAAFELLNFLGENKKYFELEAQGVRQSSLKEFLEVKKVFAATV